ncbi:hypothetical protein Tco_1009811 [Tanacetum coccineum]
MRPRRLLSDFDGNIRYHPVKASVMADALSRNERAKPFKVRALVMTINSKLPPHIHEARVEALKKKNVKDENLHGMDKEFENRLDGTLCIMRRMVVLMARYGSMHHHLCQQVLGVSKDEGRLPEAIRFTSTTRNTPLEIGKYSHGFYHKTTKDNKQLRCDLGVIRFSKRGKLNPRYIRSFKILAKVGMLSYRLKLPERLSRVHNTFHVSNLKKYLVDEPLAIPLDEIQIDDKLYFIEEPVEVMDREVKRMKQSYILIVKLLRKEFELLVAAHQVMVAPVISISSEESVGSHAPRVILFGAIPAIIPVIPKVPVVPDDPIDSLPPAPDLPLVSPFLCSDDTETNEFPLASVVAPPGFRRWPVIHIRSGKAIPFDRLYRTHLNRPHKLLTARKRVRPIPAIELCKESVILIIHRPTLCSFTTTKRFFRDSYSSEDSGEEHMEVDTADAEAVADVGISEGVVAHPEDGVGMGFEIAASDVREDDEEFEAEASAADTREIVVDPLAIGDSSESSRGGIPDLEDTIYDIVHYMSEVRIDRITEIETTQRQLETSQLVASGERASLVERIGSLRLEYLKVRAMLSIERDRIDSLRWHMALSQEEFRQVRRDRDDTRRRLRRLESYVERHLGFRP